MLFNKRTITAHRVMLLVVCTVLPVVAHGQADNWNVDGEHGEIHIAGQLTEAACRLDMVSAYQQVDLGNVSTDRLLKMGDEGQPVAFQIRLQDCLRVQSENHDERTGNLVWSENQPIVSIAFLAPADADTPSLIRLNGNSVSGVGLQLMNEHYQKLPLGEWSRPQFVNPGQNGLTFYVAPERTSAPLVEGTFQATVDFHLNYE
ncbi:fimbrial protein [Klebsiella aerogenes]|uniref:fimbrial protein n=1 Tax=Klebsiella aerogenes TaxID=548 RepID=UPI00351D2E62